MSHPKFKTKAIVFTEKEKAEIVEGIPCPAADDESVVIHTEVSGISRGTETDVFTGHFHEPGVQNFPVITGYEPVGRVAYAGKKVRHLKEGDYVIGHNLARGYPAPYSTVWGASAEYVVYSRHSAPPEWYTERFCAGRRVVRLPDSMPPERAVFASLSSVAYHGFRKVNPGPDAELVAVIGLGVVGCSAAQFYRNMGLRVLAFDLHEFRCGIARRCGIEHAVNASASDVREVVADFTNSEGADIVVECSGETDNIQMCFDIAQKNGRIHFQGAYLEAWPLVIQNSIFPKSLTVTSSCGATPLMVEETIRQIEDGRLKVEPMFSGMHTLDTVSTAYERTLNEPDKYQKLAVKW
jgi:2-desacetyl-2-hydroxyethyl bacteriochlorophyllide A dehydrogenase